MNKKDLGLLILILAVGFVVSILNPRFLLPINLSNTANMVGLFGLMAIGQAFVIITGGIELSVGSMVALVGVLFVDFIANRGVPWPVAVLLMLVLGGLVGLIHGLLITKLKLQPFIVTLCGLLVYRGIARFYTQDATAGFSFRTKFSGTHLDHRGAKLWCAAFADRPDRRGCHHGGGAAPNGLRASSLCGGKERGSGTIFWHSHGQVRDLDLCDLPAFDGFIGDLFCHVYRVDLARFTRQFL